MTRYWVVRLVPARPDAGYSDDVSLVVFSGTDITIATQILAREIRQGMDAHLLTTYGTERRN